MITPDNKLPQCDIALQDTTPSRITRSKNTPSVEISSILEEEIITLTGVPAQMITSSSYKNFKTINMFTWSWQ